MNNSTKRKPSPSDIKHSGVLGEFFFSRKTMRFFNQTMRDFKTEWHDKEAGIVRVFAPRGYFNQSNPLGGSFKVCGCTERLVDVSGSEWEVA